MDKRTKNYPGAVEMYNAGMSIEEVGRHYNRTRQAMWEWLKKRVKFRPQQRQGEENHFHRGGRTASDRAQNTLEAAIKRGIVERKTHCEKCGKSPKMRDGRTGVQAHHSDYNKPLQVDWLCQKCHHKWHKHNRAIRERR